jgi:hypothetical protein
LDDYTRQFYDPAPDTEQPTRSVPQETWDVALVCLNGHLINDRSRGNPARNAKSCSHCGAETISACPGCREPIPGFYYEEGSEAELPGHTDGRPVRATPQYCHSCGRPLPWTERAMSAARTVIREFASLDQYERDQLRRSIDDIIRETPQTPVAVLRINRALARIGGETANTLRAILVSVASDPVKQQLRSDPPAP